MKQLAFLVLVVIALTVSILMAFIAESYKNKIRDSFFKDSENSIRCAIESATKNIKDDKIGAKIMEDSANYYLGRSNACYDILKK
jgi:hypothetical protein